MSDKSDKSDISGLSEQPVSSGTGKIPPVLRSDGFIMICIYAVTLVVHILMTIPATIFNLTPDEYSVTAVAAYFNGYDWSSTVSTGGYYGYFQSLFYIPVFGITDDPYLRYRIMLIINGVLMSFAPVIIYYISRRAFKVKKTASVLFAAVCGWYPCYMLLTKYTWNETMCNILPWVFALLMYKSLDCKSTVKKQVLSVLAGLTLAAAYATHGRMLALLAAGVVLELIVFFSMKKTRIFCMTGFFGATAAGLVADKFMKSFIQRALWNIDSGKTPTNTIEKMFSRLISTGEGGMSLNDNLSPERFLDTLIGHFFYFICSTWGFGAICVVAVFSAIFIYYRQNSKKNAGAPLHAEKETPDERRAKIDDKTVIFMWFTLLVMGAIFVVSVSFKATSSLFEERMDTSIYGRYTEVFYPIAILAGMLMIYKNRFGIGHCLAALAFAGGVNVLTEVFTVPVVLGGERFVSAMILGIAPQRYNEALKDLFTQETFIKLIATNMTMLLVWMIVQLFRRGDKQLYVYFSFPLAGLLLYTNVFCFISYNVHQAKNAASGARYMEQAIGLLDGSFDSVTCYDLAKERYVKGQFLYPELDMKIVSNYSKLNALEEMPDIILTGKENCPSLTMDGVRLIGSINSSVLVYAGTEKAAAWAEEKGLRVSECNEVRYTAAELPSTTHVVKNGHDENADMNYYNAAEESVTAQLPSGAAVYTNYTDIPVGGAYEFTVYGEGVGDGRVTLTADKGETDLKYVQTVASDDKLCVRFNITKKTEGIRFKLSGSGEPITVESLTLTVAG